MRLLGFFRSLGSMWHRSRVEHEMDEELHAHIQNRADDLEKSGLARYEAERRARREFGGYEKYKEEVRETAATHFIETLLQDICYGFRTLRKSRGFTAIAILTLALGIGANTAIFSAVNGILLKPLPYAEPGKLVLIQGFQSFGENMMGLSAFDQDTWDRIREHTPAIEQMGLYDERSGTITGEAPPEKISYAAVSGSFFSTMGVQPLLGRPILPADEESDQRDVVVVGYSLWKERLGSDASALNRKIFIEGKPYRVIGVMPAGFEYPLPSMKSAWIPFAPEPGKSPVGSAIARIQKTVTLTQVNAQLKTFDASANADLKTNGKWEVRATSIKDTLVSSVQNPLLILLVAVGFVLLIACVNVSGLLLERGWSRQREVAIRCALGATRLRLIRQFLAESVMLSLAGGTLGLLASLWGIGVVRAIAPADTPRLNEMHIDPVVLCFTLGISLIAGILLGLIPALQVSAEGPGSALKGNASGLTSLSQRKTHRLRSLLVISEVALAVILVIGATLVARSFAKITSVKLGFRTDHILTLSAAFSKSACTDEHENQQCWPSTNEILRRIRSLPQVEGADAVSYLPTQFANVDFILQIEGQEQEIGLAHGVVISIRDISSHYFQTMGIPMIAGRSFDDNDREGSPHVVIVNEMFARKYIFGNPLGHRIASKNLGPSAPMDWREIVGVVADSQNIDVSQKPVAEYYLPMAQTNFNSRPSFVVRTAVDPQVMAPAIRDQVWAIDKNAPVNALLTMDQVVAKSVAEQRFRTLLLGAFGTLGFVLAMVGIYGVISYAVGQRTREIGVRMALGARPRGVLWMVLREGMLLAGVGVVVGLCGALGLTKFLQSVLFEIKPVDPLTFVSVAILLPLVAVLACYVPARRAMRVSPMEALRYE